jgi:hypothetical protein
MPVARSRAKPEAAAVAAVSPAFDWWMSAFESLSPLDRNASAWGRVAQDAHEAGEAAARHWRALAEIQVAAAGEAFDAGLKLATAQAERRREALTHLMETLWPTPARARPREEAARV